ncbi:MAG: 4'-phosphopantetheinyl transferase superfamily protein, partial [Verrucomicrobiota bacterium]
AHLHFIHPDDARSTDCLNESERRRADRFVFPEDGIRWRSYRVGLREILSAHLGIEPREVPIAEGPNGKPILLEPHQDLHFNLSHSDDLAAVVVSKDAPVGIDLEPWSRADSLIECSDSFCHPAELRSLPADIEPRARRLLEIWTSKEALLKAIGTGLTYPPQLVRIDGDRGVTDRPLKGAGNYRLVVPNHPHRESHRLALALNDTTEIVLEADD